MTSCLNAIVQFVVISWDQIKKGNDLFKIFWRTVGPRVNLVNVVSHGRFAFKCRQYSIYFFGEFDDFFLLYLYIQVISCLIFFLFLLVDICINSELTWNEKHIMLTLLKRTNISPGGAVSVFQCAFLNILSLGILSRHFIMTIRQYWNYTLQ